MITEDYISFETAKLLKEKGFDADIDLWYNSDGEIFHLYHYDYNATKHFACVECPTLQMAMKWLREEHKINIEVFYFNPDDRAWWAFEITKLPSGACVFGKYDISNYEEACEEAIKYCLENLI